MDILASRYPQENHSNKLKINAPRASVAEAFFFTLYTGVVFHLHTYAAYV